MIGTAQTSMLLGWLISHGCISEIEPKPYVNVTEVFKSSCPVPGAVTAPKAIAPEPAKPAIIKSKPKAKATRKRSSACGSRRQVWRTLSGGHRKYRCVR